MNSLIKSFFNPLLPIPMLAGLSFAHAAPPIIEPVDVNVLNTPGVVVENSSAEPVPVVVQKVGRIFLHGQVDLPEKGDNALDPRPIVWERPDSITPIDTIPEGYALFLTDIVVSWNDDFSLPTADEPSVLIFALMEEGGAIARLMACSGTGLPYSHSFTTPLFFNSLNYGTNVRLGITRLSDARVLVTLTGYLEPIAE